MSLPSYVVNFDELKDLLKDNFSNIIVKDISSLYGTQRVKGFCTKIPAIKEKFYVVKYEFPKNAIMTGIVFSQSAWKPEDYWELYVGRERIFDTIYTKEIASKKTWQCIYPINLGTEMTIILNNVSGNSRTVWVDIEYLEIADTIQRGV